MKGLKIEFPVAAFLTAAIYLNAYFFQVGALGFYGYPNITGDLSVSMIVENVVPGLMFYFFSFVFFLSTSIIRYKFIVFFVELIPAVVFMFWLYVINDFEKAIGVDRFSEIFNVTLLLIAFYSVRWWVAGFKIIPMQASTSNYIFIGMLMSSIVFSGSALGRMSAYFLNDVYKVDGKDNSYILKVYNDRVIIAECDISHLKYTLESDLPKYKMTRLQDKEEKLKLRGCLLKHVKNLVV